MKTLYSSGRLRAIIYNYNGKCKGCNKQVKITSIEPNDQVCVECQYKLKPMSKDYFQ